ncbi:MAG: ATP-binding cassette domain-containing protein [Burkholderiaceae bacterium]
MAVWCDLNIRKQLRSAQRVFELDVQLQTDHPRLAITGPSGIGKTMMLRAIAGLIRPDVGHIRIHGRPLYDSTERIDLPARERHMGFMFQNYALLPQLTALGNVGFGLRRGAWGVLSRTQKAEAMHWLDRFQIAHVAHQYPHTLSGGQQQRLALARLAITQPRALLLDEPFAALDPDLRQAMRVEVDGLLRALGIPLLMITHDATDRIELQAQELRLAQVDGKTVRV